MGRRIGQGREEWRGEGCLQSKKDGELYLAVGLYEGYAPILQWPQAKGYSNLRAK